MSAALPRVPILGVPVSAITLDDAVSAVEDWILARRRHYVCITGAHGVIECQTDRALRAIHERAGLVTPDGMPLVFMARRLGFPRTQRVYGPDLMRALTALSARKGMDLSVLELRVAIMEWMGRLGIDPSFGDRYLNEGFSGGEKKRNEILQMALLEPVFAVLDETDSGLDIDALKIVSRGVQEVRADRKDLGVLLITHYQRLLNYIRPQFVHILYAGKIIQSGGPELALQLEEQGYDPIIERYGPALAAATGEKA